MRLNLQWKAGGMMDSPSEHLDEPFEDTDLESGELSGGRTYGKSKVDCICPGCGGIHVMKIHWIGRGVPRKFCQNCKDRETPLDDDDY
jgi:hypothetical protein